MIACIQIDVSPRGDGRSQLQAEDWELIVIRWCSQSRDWLGLCWALVDLAGLVQWLFDGLARFARLEVPLWRCAGPA